MKEKKTMKQENSTIVEITWLDACSEEHYLTIEAIRNLKPLIRKNVGYKVDMTDNHITISGGTVENMYHGEVGYDGAMAIPRSMIIETRAP